MLVVSHRISVLERADRVIVLDRGRVIDEGHHRELAVREGPYREAWRRQTDEGSDAVMRPLTLLARLPSQWRRFARDGNAAAVIAAMHPHLSRYRWRFAAVFALLPVSAGMAALVPYLTKVAVDDYLLPAVAAGELGALRGAPGRPRRPRRGGGWWPATSRTPSTCASFSAPAMNC